jgi:hypothetical protein
MPRATRPPFLSAIPTTTPRTAILPAPDFCDLVLYDDWAATLHALWSEPGRGDEYVGTLVNAYLARGGHAVGVPAGQRYYDVGTVDGYRAAIDALRHGAPHHSTAGR